MADWTLPTIRSKVAEVIDFLLARDRDVATLFLVDPTGHPIGTVKLNRSPVKFQEYNGTEFVDLVLSPAGGGTGANTIEGARAAMGIGTMALQNNNAVNITGGAINVGVLAAASGAAIENLDASKLTTGTIPNDRFPSTLPGLNGQNLTNLNGSQIVSGTVVAARIGVLDASKVTTGVFATARLGTGTADQNKVLLGNGTWGDYSMFTAGVHNSVSFGTGEATKPFIITGLGATHPREIMVQVNRVGNMNVSTSGAHIRLDWTVPDVNQVVFTRTVLGSGSLPTDTIEISVHRVRMPT